MNSKILLSVGFISGVATGYWLGAVSIMYFIGGTALGVSAQRKFNKVKHRREMKDE